MTASIVISIDFELRWGIQDTLGVDFAKYRRNLEGAREAVPAIAEMFVRKNVRATWAIVGAIACEGWDEWEARAPEWPRYEDGGLAWNPTSREKDPRGALYFAPDLVELVRTTPGQELGSHTFSHVYMREPGFVRRDAVADTVAVLQLFRDKWNTSPTSFVFPRNQVAFEDVLAENGFTVWRANPKPFFQSATTAAQQSVMVRALRLLDAIAPLGTRTYRRHPTIHRASHFVRFGLPNAAWKAHLRRLASEAARLRDDDILHLWWHPHNLGADVARCTQRLEHLLDTIAERAPSYAHFSTMSEAVTVA